MSDEIAAKRSESYKMICLREKEVKLLAKIDAAQLELERVHAEMLAITSWSLDDLELSVRAWNCLSRTDGPARQGYTWGYLAPANWVPPTPSIKTIGDLVQWSPDDLLKMKNFGCKCLTEVQALLSEIGLMLREPEAANGDR